VNIFILPHSVLNVGGRRPRVGWLSVQLKGAASLLPVCEVETTTGVTSVVAVGQSRAVVGRRRHVVVILTAATPATLAAKTLKSTTAAF